VSKHEKIGIGRRLKGLMLKRVHGMITCREFEDFISGYLDGELSSRKRSRFDLHLRLCRECRQYLQAYQQTIAVGQAAFAAPDEPVPDDVPRELINSILKLHADDPAGD